MFEPNTTIHNESTHENAFEMSTGIPSVDAMRMVHLEGNITPAAWFKTIVNRKIKKPSYFCLSISSSIKALSNLDCWADSFFVRQNVSCTSPTKRSGRHKCLPLLCVIIGGNPTTLFVNQEFLIQSSDSV